MGGGLRGMVRRCEAVAAGRGGIRLWALVVILALGLGLSLARLDPELSLIGDDAQYVVLAKSLLSGHGLSHINDPLIRPHTKYPPLYPLLLAPLVKAFPHRVVPLKLLSVASALVSLWLTFQLVERRGGVGVAAATGLLLAVNLRFLGFAQEVLAEMPFVAISLAALWFLDLADRRLETGRSPWMPVLVSLGLAVAAYYTRTVGLALGAGAGVLFLFRRRFRWALLYWGGFAAAALPWALRNRSLGSSSTYLQMMFLRDPYQPELGTVGLSEFVLRVGENFLVYVDMVVPKFLAPLSWWSLYDLSPRLAVLGGAMTALVLVGLITRLARRPGALELYFVIFVGVNLTWPPVWSSERFLIPVLPLLFFYMLDGGRILLAWGRRLFPPLGSPVTAALLVIALVGVEASITAKALALPRGYLHSPGWPSYFAAADWVRETTPPESVIVCRKPFLFHFRSQRRTIGYPFADPEGVLRSMREHGATHVVVDYLSTTTDRYLIPALQHERDQFQLVHVDIEVPFGDPVSDLRVVLDREVKSSRIIRVIYEVVPGSPYVSTSVVEVGGAVEEDRP